MKPERMRVVRLLALIVLCIGAQAVAEPVTRPVAVARLQGFKPVVPALRAYLGRQEAKVGLHHLCVIGYRTASAGEVPSVTVWVHWREGQRLVLWGPAGNGFESAETLIHANRDLDLTTDVVGTDDAVAGSTYRVTKAWVNRTLADCRARGTHYALRVRARKP